MTDAELLLLEKIRNALRLGSKYNLGCVLTAGECAIVLMALVHYMDCPIEDRED